MEETMAGQRFNFYKGVHKGIRAVVHGLVEQAQTTDFTQRTEVLALERRVEEAFSVFEGHAAHETTFITPLLRSAAPQLALESDAEHREQELRLRDLRRSLAHVASAGPAAATLGHSFVVALSRFEGEMLVHMADEEERLMPALWARFGDLTLHQVHQSLLESIPPGEKRRALGWMLPALSRPEQAEFLAGIRASAEPAAFEAVQSLAREVLGALEWDRLERAMAAAA